MAAHAVIHVEPDVPILSMTRDGLLESLLHVDGSGVRGAGGAGDVMDNRGGGCVELRALGGGR